MLAGNQKYNAKYTSEVGEGDFYAAVGPDFFVMPIRLLGKCCSASPADSVGCIDSE